VRIGPIAACDHSRFAELRVLEHPARRDRCRWRPSGFIDYVRDPLAGLTYVHEPTEAELQVR
jgi:hypothetical protein